MVCRTLHCTLLGAALLLAPAAGSATETIFGSVVSVIDGDSLVVIDCRGAAHRVRIADIDAPERGQPFSERAKRSLSETCMGREAAIEQRALDRYGRIVGRVVCGGVDAGVEQVRRGMAWVYDRSHPRPGLRYLQELAKTQRLGLWSDHAPTPPWQWRAHQHRAEPRS